MRHVPSLICLILLNTLVKRAASQYDDEDVEELEADDNANIDVGFLYKLEEEKITSKMINYKQNTCAWLTFVTFNQTRALRMGTN